MNPKGPNFFTDWHKIQKDLGCYGCRFANADLLSSEGCCVLTEGFTTAPDGKCISRRPLEIPPVIDNAD